mgnify:CR=1 FL=1
MIGKDEKTVSSAIRKNIFRIGLVTTRKKCYNNKEVLSYIRFCYEIDRCSFVTENRIFQHIRKEFLFRFSVDRKRKTHYGTISCKYRKKTSDVCH